MKTFEEWPKIARLNRTCVITEKLDGTNASIYIPEPGMEEETITMTRALPFLCGSRTRWVFPENDNAGFATWAYAHADELLTLGPGHHFGEWWGAGIQRKYGLSEKRFSLFNVARWIRSEADRVPQAELHENRQRVIPACCDIVPILYSGPFTTEAVRETLAHLVAMGSAAAPGFMKPEGVVVYHEAARTMFKVTVEKDEQPKGRRE